MPDSLKIKDVGHFYGNNKVLNKVNLEVERGQFVALVGPSGCGKSTCLRAILGTHPPTEGKIYLGNKEVNGPTRDIGIVYQHYNLYPFLTALENVAFGPMVDETTILYRIFCFWQWWKLKKEHLIKSKNILNEYGLGNAADKYPSDLSGGMRQRVAIARAVIMNPDVLLLDEPFGALDEVTRHELQLMLLRLYQKNVEAKEKGKKPPFTVIFVTHELNEAFYVADRVIGLSQYHDLGFPGATVTYDEAAPVFTPTCPRDFDLFREQKEVVKEIVFKRKD